MENFKPSHIASILLLKHLREEISEEERKELNAWRVEAQEHERLFIELTNEKTLGEGIAMLNGLKERLDRKVFSKIPEAKERLLHSVRNDEFASPPSADRKDDRLASNDESLLRETRNDGKVRKIVKRWAVAASIVLMMGLGTYVLFFNKPAKQDEIVRTPVVPNDVKAPEANRAMITLADGRKIYLDSVGGGQLAVQSNVKLMKTTDGKIAYEGSSTSINVTYNTLTNPRGSKVIDMTLADGSRVWLNAGSSITYPVAFISNERKVTITGEGYFEIEASPNPSEGEGKRKFIVESRGVTTEVLGTHFNVNAYDDESDIKVTLLEGSVKVALASPRNDGQKSEKIIKPGEQVMASINGQLAIRKDADIEEVMAWKNGYFNFKSLNIEAIMKQISRWYDIDVSYDGNVGKETFSGIVKRNSNVSQVLEIIKQGGVEFKIERKKITITP